MHDVLKMSHSSEKFENLEDDLSSVVDKLRPSVNSISNETGERKKNLIRLAEKKLEDANFIIQEMENEAKAAPVQYRTQMLGRLRNYKRDVESLTREVKKGVDAGFSSADNYGFDSNQRMESSQRARLVQGTQSLNRTTDSIARSHQIAAETDEVGTEILGELGRQREVLIRTSDRLHGTDANLARSRKILKTMAMRVMTNKMILIVIILVQLAILAGVVYWKFFS